MPDVSTPSAAGRAPVVVWPVVQQQAAVCTHHMVSKVEVTAPVAHRKCWFLEPSVGMISCETPANRYCPLPCWVMACKTETVCVQCVA